MSANGLTPNEARERLEEIQGELIALLDEALTLTGRSGERGWYATAVCAITRNHDYLDRSSCLADYVGGSEDEDEV